MNSLVEPARVLVDPLEGLGAAVEARRWVWPMVFLALSVCASGVAFSQRWEAGPAVVRQLEMSGKLDRMTESEIADEVQTASRKALVGGVAKGLFIMPLLTLLLAVALWICGWLLETPAPFGRYMSVAALALLPVAVYHLAFAVCALSQHSLTDMRAAELVPSHLGLLAGLSPKAKQALSGVDFFNLWSTALLGLGFSAATGLSRGRSLLLAVILYCMYVGVFLVGVPAMMMGGPR